MEDLHVKERKEPLFDLNKSPNSNDFEGEDVVAYQTFEDNPNKDVSGLPLNESSLDMQQKLSYDYIDAHNESVEDVFDDHPDMTTTFTTSEIFLERKDLIEWCVNTGKPNGIVIIIGKSDSYESGRTPRVLLTCEKSGRFRPKKSKEVNKLIVSKSKRRNTGTKKCDCPFKLKGSQHSNGGWELTVKCGTHNHSLGNNLIGHAFVARLNPDEKVLVADMSEAGVRPRQMLSFLKKRNPENLSTRSTLYNYRSRHRLTNLQGRSTMQQLMKHLDELQYYKFHKVNPLTGELTDLFFAHQLSIQTALCFPEVFVMDCTYKTNIHKLPLLEIVGFTSTLKTFSVAFVYLDSEKEENFVWALERFHDVIEEKASNVQLIMTDRDLALVNAVGRVFSKAEHHLCRWHIEKNITSKCKKSFKTNDAFENFMGSVAHLMRSTTEADFTQNLCKFRNEYSKLPKVVRYVEDNWLTPYKEKFVSAWTDSVTHFGTHTSNRAESMHSSLKRHLDSSVGNLLQNWKAIENLLGNQITEIQASFNRSRQATRHKHNVVAYKEIVGLVAREAIDFIEDEMQRSNFVGTKEKCGCVLRRAYGLPCAHELGEMVKLGSGHIPLSSIHPRWRKLDIVPMELPMGSVDILPELQAVQKKFNSVPEHQQVLILKQLAEIADPKTTLMHEPKEKTSVKGRPPTSKYRAKSSSRNKNDTKREPSAFEYAQTEEEKITSEQVKKKRGRPRKVIGDVQAIGEKDVNGDAIKGKVFDEITDEEKISDKLPKKRGRPRKKHGKELLNPKHVIDIPLKWEPHLKEINPMIRDWITDYQPVPGDGHCGFRSIAKHLEYDEHLGWKTVRIELLQELMAHQWEYVVLFGPDQFLSLKTNLECTTPTTDDLKEWFDLPDMGYLTANAYNCAFVNIDPKEQQTWLPLRTPPGPEGVKIIAVAHIWAGLHFVPIKFGSDSPLPPVSPGWNQISKAEAKVWLQQLQSRISL